MLIKEVFMNTNYWKRWVKAAGVRAIKTVAQTAVALIGTNSIGMTDVNWQAVISAAVLSGVVSMLTSVAGIPEVTEDDDLPDVY